MAENQPSSTINAAFPAPPPYYKSFTPTNIALLEIHLNDSQQGSSQESSHQKQAPQALTTRAPLPPDLTHLVPPLPPKDGIYRLFGTQHNILPSPSSIQPPTHPTPTRLISLTRSILLTFLSLTHALVTAPATYGTLWETLREQFFEIHDVVNEYRPHQLRETLIAMMEAQVERCREEGEKAREMGRKVKEVLEGMGGGGWEERVGKMGNEGGGENEEEERRVWEVVWREVGFG